MINLAQALAAARAQHGEQASYITLQTLLAYVVGKDRAWLLAHQDEVLTPGQTQLYMDLAQRAAQGEPLAYITGQKAFGLLSFDVEHGVLVPRPETESLVDLVVDWVHRQAITTPQIVDVGTGSGVIAVSLAVRLAEAEVYATDIAPEAVRITRQNAAKHEVADRVHCLQGSLLDPVRGQFDVIAANLPYIDSDELRELVVTDWEPLVALDGGQQGVALITRLLEQAPRQLKSPGLLILEMGYNQGQAVGALCRAAFPTAHITLHKDLAQLDRIMTVEIQPVVNL